MIRTILLTHRYTDAISSASVCLFFRMAGIYVVEKYLDFNVDLRAEMIEFGITPERNREMFCDAEVALFPTKERQIEYLGKHTDRSRLVDICYEEISDMNGDGGKIGGILEYILNGFERLGLLEGKRYKDLCALRNVFLGSDYVRTVMLSKYFFVLEEEQWVENMKEGYRRVVRAIQRTCANTLNEEAKEFYHLRFALINTAYEANLYCKRNEKPPIYSSEEIVDIANNLKNKSGNLLERSIETLMAQMEMNLFIDGSGVYDRLIELCRNDTLVNAYVYFLKGNFEIEVENNLELASKYYANAIARFPEYYRAWYQLGLCCYKKGELERARKAFYNVVKILTVRYEGNVLRPMEVEYLFNSCVMCGKIQESYSAYKSALRHYNMAKSVWYSITTSDFFAFLFQDIDGKQKADLIEQIKEEFDMDDLERRIEICNY